MSAHIRSPWVRQRFLEAAETGTRLSAPWTDVIRSPFLWAFIVIWIMSSAGSYGLQSWVPTVVKEVTRIGIGNVGLLSAIPYLLAIVLLFTVGYASDRVHRRDVFIFVGFVLAGLAIFFGPEHAADQLAALRRGRARRAGVSDAASLDGFDIA